MNSSSNNVVQLRPREQRKPQESGQVEILNCPEDGNTSEKEYGSPPSNEQLSITVSVDIEPFVKAGYDFIKNLLYVIFFAWWLF